MRCWHDKRLKLKHAIEAIRLVENFHFQYTAVTSLRGSGGIAAMYSKHARDLNQAKADIDRLKAIRDLKPKMEARLPSTGEFTSGIEQRVYFSKERAKNRSLAEYVLWKLHRHLNPKAASNRKLFSIEHILPESEKKNGVKEEVISSIGNLILVPIKLNNEDLGNHAFLQKKRHWFILNFN